MGLDKSPYVARGCSVHFLMTDMLNLIDVVSVALELNNQAANERTIESLEEFWRDF